MKPNRSIREVLRPYRDGSLLVLCSLLLPVAGCSSGGDKPSLRNMVRNMTGPSASELAAWAFDPNDPDKRREGVIGLSSRDWGLKEPYLKGYAALLRTDTDPMVRAAAARALGKAGDPTYAPDVTRGLLDRDVAVRQDCATALDRVYDANSAMYLRTRARNDTDQDVRAKCCRALRHHRDLAGVRALVNCLDDKEYSVRFQAHRSLVEIVGVDRGLNPEAWQDVAAGATLPPAPAAAPEKPWWDWMGVTETPRPEPAPEPEPEPKPAPAEAPKRPWWDWMGVTKTPRSEPEPEPEPEPKGPKAP